MKTLKPQFQRLTSETRLYQLPCPLIGLTGSIGTGKSTVTNYLKTLGLSVLCADQLIKLLYQEQATLALVKNLFPHCIEGQQVDFKQLRLAFFKSPDKKGQLLEHLYGELPRRFLQSYRELGDPPVLLYDVPLLFENHLESSFDLTVLVDATPELQRQRVQARDQVSADQVEVVMSAQLPLEIKRQRADSLILNDADLNTLYRRTDQWVSEHFD